MKVRKLTPKQARFVAEYLVDLNATQAAIRAGYSMKTADSIGLQLLRKTQVASAIQRGQEERAQRVEVTQDMVVRELARVAFSDARRLFREDGSLKAPHELDDDTAAALASIEILEEYAGSGKERCLVGYTKKVRRWDKTKALELLGRHLSMWKDAATLTVRFGLADLLEDGDDGNDS